MYSMEKKGGHALAYLPSMKFWTGLKQNLDLACSFFRNVTVKLIHLHRLGQSYAANARGLGHNYATNAGDRKSSPL